MTARPSWADRGRFVLRGIGQTLITLGVVVLLFVVYEVYVSNFFARQAQHTVQTELQRTWRTDTVDPLLPLPDGSAPALPEGQGIAWLYIPRLGRDYGYAIVEGTSAADLEKGPGHYPDSALPGQVGNFAVAGHRVGKGEPFLNLDHLRAGDAVIVQTKSEWFVYTVEGRPGDIAAAGADGLPGREIVAPSDVAVVDPVPGRPGATPTEALMTMTTCHPKFTARNRMVVFAGLRRTVAAHGLAMPGTISAYFSAQES